MRTVATEQIVTVGSDVTLVCGGFFDVEECKWFSPEVNGNQCCYGDGCGQLGVEQKVVR